MNAAHHAPTHTRRADDLFRGGRPLARYADADTSTPAAGQRAVGALLGQPLTRRYDIEGYPPVFHRALYPRARAHAERSLGGALAQVGCSNKVMFSIVD